MRLTEKVQVFNTDCMDYMKDIPDGYFELAIADPPYGIGISKNPVRQQHNKKEWDDSIPSRDYFNELFRVSKNQIIWGGKIGRASCRERVERAVRAGALQN